ncbi:hypothetical protein B566_EDAN006599 [Ephemera danica]|nr:hypothetical protein B566_EDAN006599 [Ephemera danica]
MSLVAAYSGSSDEESGDVADPPSPAATKPSSSKVLLNQGDRAESKETVGMFSSLPAPKKETAVADIIEDDSDIVIPSKPSHVKKEIPPGKQKVKISIPSLSDFKDEEDSAPRAKKIRPTPKGSGLLAILPEPKNTSIRPSKAMVPHVLTKRPTPKPTPAQIKAKAQKKPPSTLLPNYADSDEDSGDEGHSSALDFFSLTGQTAPVPAEINLEDLLPPTQGPSGKPAPPQSVVQTQIVQSVVTEEQQPESAEQDLQLDEEALRQLCGRRAQRGGEEVNIIELHGDNMMPDPKEWMLKQMTEEQESHAHKSSQPSSAHRRKHQITYLAFQAKEREIELKNQWAQNRMTKKQTQSKYGF